jgi:hypothetical protein
MLSDEIHPSNEKNPPLKLRAGGVKRFAPSKGTQYEMHFDESASDGGMTVELTSPQPSPPAGGDGVNSYP